MTIPTSWTDNGLTWETANPMWDLMSLNLAMIEAIKEKDSATGRTVPALLSATYNPIRPNRDYVNAIHSEVTGLIPLFVNHTDHGGDYNGQTAIPTWTEATILTAIGDPARIVPSNLNVLSPWYFQTRKILDLLRWGQKIIIPSSAWARELYGQPSFAVGKTNINATEWTYISNGINTHVRSASNTSGGVYIYAFEQRAGIYNWLNNSLFAVEINAYFSFKKWAELEIYENLDYPVAINQFSLVKSDTVAVGDNCSVTVTKVDFSITGCPEGGGQGYVYKSNIFILKFDGANGFRFRA